MIAGQFPTYLGALDAWRPRLPTFRNLVLDAPGFDPATIFRGAQFAYTVPNFSNPTGKLVGLDMRAALVDAAHRTGTWLVEDDPYGGLHYDGAPLPRLIELSARKSPGAYDGPVLYMGTLSKEIAPGLRIGWVIGAPEMIAALTLAKQGSDMCTSGVTQRIALGALEAGLIEQIQPGIVELYRSRRDALCAALAEHLSAWFQWEGAVRRDVRVGNGTRSEARHRCAAQARHGSRRLRDAEQRLRRRRRKPPGDPDQLHPQRTREAARGREAPRRGSEGDASQQELI